MKFKFFVLEYVKSNTSVGITSLGKSFFLKVGNKIW